MGSAKRATRRTQNQSEAEFGRKIRGRKIFNSRLSESSCPQSSCPKVFFCPHVSAQWPGGLAGRSGGFQPPVGAWKAPLLRTAPRVVTSTRRSSVPLHSLLSVGGVFPAAGRSGFGLAGCDSTKAVAERCPSSRHSQRPSRSDHGLTANQSISRARFAQGAEAQRSAPR
jgi:hypothetical protein